MALVDVELDTREHRHAVSAARFSEHGVPAERVVVGDSQDCDTRVGVSFDQARGEGGVRMRPADVTVLVVKVGRRVDVKVRQRPSGVGHDRRR